MIRFAILLSLLLLLSGSLRVAGFAPASVCRPTATAISVYATAPTNKEEDDYGHPSSLFSEEISRRMALVLAAASVTSVGQFAQAASLASIVSGLESEFASEVNTKGAPEKHIPTVEVSGGSSVKIVVPHVMDPEKPHYIQYIWLKDESTGKVVSVKGFQASDASPPTLTVASVKKGSKVKPLLFCNLHGLWQGEVVSV